MAQPQPQPSRSNWAPSSGLGSLVEAYEKPHGQFVTIMGIVTDVMQARKIRTGEWMLTCTIKDPDLDRVPTDYNGIKVRAFCNYESELPLVKAVGDVILLRNVKASRIAGQPLLLTDKRRSSYVVFPANSFSTSSNTTHNHHMKSTYFPAHPVSAPSEQEYKTAVSLKKQMSFQGTSFGTMSAGTTGQQTPRTRQLNKFTLIKDAAPDKFYDVVVEIVKIFPGQYEYNELYVTDYTINPFLYNYPSPDEEDDGLTRDGDPYGFTAPMSKREWPGPYGSMTLKVEVREPHASLLNDKMKEGNLIHIQNVRMKMSREGKMEGNLWPDNKYPDKVLLHHHAYEDDSKVQELEKRKSEYWLHHKKSAKQQGGGSKQESKGQRKKRKEREKKAAVSEPAAKRIKLPPVSKSDLHTNPHMRCIATKAGIQPSSLSQILAADRTYTHPNGEEQILPFINQKRKAIVRVVDFYPPTLEGFCRFVHTPQNRGEDSSGVECTTQRWEWCFTLLVESVALSGTDADDSGPQMWVQVNHTDADFMLKMDATDLASDENTLARLREKLAILWGNLEERKAEMQLLTEKDISKPSEAIEDSRGAAFDAQLSNLPFECCIMEYGVEMSEEDKSRTAVKAEFVQVFGMFGVTIMSV